MATIADVYRFEAGIGSSSQIISIQFCEKACTATTKLEAAMMEEFGCDIEGLRQLPKDTTLGPKAEAALLEGQRMCFSDPMSLAKATALRWPEAIDGWQKEAREKGAKFIVIGNDSWDYEDFPIYAMSREQADEERAKLDHKAGVYYVETITVSHN